MAKTAEELEAERVEAEKKAAKLKADIAAGVCDDEGVPYKNRAKEAERKRDVAENARLEAENLRLETQRRLDALNTPAPVEPVDEDPWSKQQQDKVDRAIEKFKGELRAEKEADSIMKGLLDKLEVDPLIKKYRFAIEARLSGMSANLKANPHSVKMLADTVIGEHVKEILQDNAPAIDDGTGRRLIKAESEVLGAHPSPPGSAVIVLTADEQAYSDSHQLADKKWTNLQIRDWCKKVAAKKLAEGK